MCIPRIKETETVFYFADFCFSGAPCIHQLLQLPTNFYYICLQRHMRVFLTGEGEVDFF